MRLWIKLISLVPVAQVVPVYPAVHKHTSGATHVPPFWQVWLQRAVKRKHPMSYLSIVSQLIVSLLIMFRCFLSFPFFCFAFFDYVSLCFCLLFVCWFLFCFCFALHEQGVIKYCITSLTGAPCSTKWAKALIMCHTRSSILTTWVAQLCPKSNIETCWYQLSGLSKH